MELISERGKSSSSDLMTRVTLMLTLILSSAHSVMQKVTSAVLVVGQGDIPQIPRDEDELRRWYIKVSSYCPYVPMHVELKT